METGAAFIQAMSVVGIAAVIVVIIVISAKYIHYWTLVWVAVVYIIMLTIKFKNG